MTDIPQRSDATRRPDKAYACHARLGSRGYWLETAVLHPTPPVLVRRC